MRLTDLQEACSDAISASVFKVGSELRIQDLDTLSRAILSNSQSRKYPDLFEFGFFCRAANLRKRLQLFGWCRDRLGLGLVVHITPSNIPMNFALSFLFGYLSGNNNVVKVPKKEFPQVELFLDIFSALRAKGAFVGQQFVRFSRDDACLATVVGVADALLVWGGDATIEQVRQITRKPRCVVWEFPDRFSIAVIDVGSVNKLDEANLKQLASRFYNDTLLVNQNACSSPKLIAWLGDSGNSDPVISRFWKAFLLVAREREFELGPVEHISRLVKVMEYCMTTNCKQVSPISIGSLIERIQIDSGDRDWMEHLGSDGLFYEINVKNLSELTHIACNGKLQTVGYFGIAKTDLLNLVLEKNIGSGVDKIVPIGTTLNYSIQWDGVNSLERLSREIYCV